MKYDAVMDRSRELFDERGAAYGDVSNVHGDIAMLATIILGREVTKYEVSTIFECAKLARRKADPAYVDNYVDQINYTAFSAQFATEG